jgi:hypothetical protein
MWIFSSAEYCLRVARRIPLIALVAPVYRVCDFCLICVPFGHYDEPEILSYAIPMMCSIGADVRQFFQDYLTFGMGLANKKDAPSILLKKIVRSLIHQE